jgi:hypothetical protein
MCDVNPYFTTRAVAQNVAYPILRGQTRNEAFHRDGLTVSNRLRRRATSTRRGRRHHKLRTFGPNPLRTVDICDKDLVRVVQLSEKPGLFSVASVDTYPFKPHLPGARCTHHVKRVLTLRDQLPRGLGHARVLAPRGVVNPTTWQVKSHVDGDMVLSIRQNGEYGDLTVVHFALPA